MAQVVFEQVRDRYKQCVEAKKPKMIAVKVAEALGLCTADGVRHFDEGGRPTLAKDRKHRAADFHPQILADAIIGRDWAQQLGLDTGDPHLFPMQRWLSEAEATPIGPSQWANIAAWSATVSGLMQAQFLEAYQQTEFDLVDLFPTRPPIFWQGGERIPDVLGPYEPASEVGPGEPYPDVAMSGLWVEPGPMKKYAGKITVAKETAFIDISGGQILAKAKTAADTLRYREQLLTEDVILGVTNNWKLGMLADSAATGYNTYGATITNPRGGSRTIPNDNVNPLNDVGALQKSDEYIAGLYHPVTDNPIAVDMDTIILPTVLNKPAEWLMGVNEVWGMPQTTNPAMATAPGTFPNSVQKSNNPWQGKLKPVVSRWLHKRHTDSTSVTNSNRPAGLGLTNAGIYRWYRCDPRKFAAKRMAWPSTIIDLNPNDWVMATQGVIAGQAFDIAVMIQVLNAYAIQRNKGA